MNKEAEEAWQARKRVRPAPEITTLRKLGVPPYVIRSLTGEQIKAIAKEPDPMRFIKTLLECPDSPSGKHEYTLDMEYDPSGDTENCEWCGELKPAR
jgi:hypothetical protein